MYLEIGILIPWHTQNVNINNPPGEVHTYCDGLLWTIVIWKGNLFCIWKGSSLDRALEPSVKKSPPPPLPLKEKKASSYFKLYGWKLSVWQFKWNLVRVTLVLYVSILLQK